LASFKICAKSFEITEVPVMPLASTENNFIIRRFEIQGVLFNVHKNLLKVTIPQIGKRLNCYLVGRSLDFCLQTFMNNLAISSG